MRPFSVLFFVFISISAFCQSDTSIFPGKEFVYTYSILRDGDTCLFVFQEPILQTGSNARSVDANWDYCPAGRLQTCRGEVAGTVGLRFPVSISPDSFYYTREIYYNLYREKIHESIAASVINPGEIWLHPPRMKGFRILECNPFPHIRFDSTGWSWKLEVGGEWGDIRWKIWEGTVQFQFEYQKTGEQTLFYQGRLISCTVVEAKSHSPLGSSGATFWYSPLAGFLKMEFRNIDGSILTMNLLEIRS